VSCRCDLECENLSVDKCLQCYSIGGMVLESYPGGCYCPFDNSFLDLNNSNSSCQNPLPTCPTCFICDSSCFNCFGPNSTQCTSCPPNLDLVTTLNSDGFFSLSFPFFSLFLSVSLFLFFFLSFLSFY